MISRIGFILCHGWSFTASTLEPLADVLCRHTPHVLLDDLGYWSDETHTAPRNPHIAWIAVGHSYGFAHLMRTTATPWHAAVGIGAFLTFPRDGLEAMREALTTDPQLTVRAFRRRCDLQTAETIPRHHAAGHARLLATLDVLQTLQLAAPSCPTLFLHGANDRIVPPPANSTVLGSTGHNLGIDKAEWCSAQIQSFMRSLRL